ncbi:hypothetical protein [Ferroacidibacillus organovorans]|uniref:Uncharacterized protein n=1 Tax=Ferroacidibacillus organovorans TaxID=1765683 RepID=A0A1V4EXE9_9BACL|nr:hypothetical protein [Ferroacidibacillus organovorans]OPG17606.1 hypothetical protein B2M26_00150 [Ferroacidibacillus organovorans]
MSDFELNIGSVSSNFILSNSGIYVGKTRKTHVRATSKANAGFGKITGDENKFIASTRTKDFDFFDTIKKID